MLQLVSYKNFILIAAPKQLNEGGFVNSVYIYLKDCPDRGHEFVGERSFHDYNEAARKAISFGKAIVERDFHPFL